jgi:hypothetical protein
MPVEMVTRKLRSDMFAPGIVSCMGIDSARQSGKISLPDTPKS